MVNKTDIKINDSWYLMSISVISDSKWMIISIFTLDLKVIRDELDFT